MNQNETVKALLERRRLRKKQRIIRTASTTLCLLGMAVCLVCLIILDREDARALEENHTYIEEAQSAPMRSTAVEVKEIPVQPEEIPEEIQEEEPAAVPEEYPEDYENEKIEAALLDKAHRMDDVMITHYCSELYPHICGTGNGITASGREIEPYVSVAVDRSVIPLGSEVMIDYGDGEIHYYRADDVGAWVNGAHIDVAVTTHDEALQLGIKTATVWWIPPEKGGE